MVGALRTFYSASRKAVLDSVPAFDVQQIESVRGDLREIMLAMPA